MKNTSSILKLINLFGESKPQVMEKDLFDNYFHDEIVEYYREIGPIDLYIPGHGNDYFLPALQSLKNYQNGYSFNPMTNSRIANWNMDWIVLADQGGDPFIFSKMNKNIFQNLHLKRLNIFELLFGFL